MWQIMHCESRLDKLRHSTKRAHMQGGLLWNQCTDPIEGEKCYNLYMKQRQNKTWTKIIQKTIPNAYFTHFIGLIGPYKACTLSIQICWVTSMLTSVIAVGLWVSQGIWGHATMQHSMAWVSVRCHWRLWCAQVGLVMSHGLISG